MNLTDRTATGYAKAHMVEQLMVYGRSARDPLRFRRRLERLPLARLGRWLRAISG